METSFKIIVPFYNVEKWIKFCIRSIKAQNYKNYKVILVNDESNDGTVDIIKKEIQDNDKFSLMHTGKNGGALNSTFLGILEANPEDEDVIIVLDGDDWLANKDVFNILNTTYLQNKCLMTYGSYMEYPSKTRGKFSRQLPDTIVKDKLFRKFQWSTSHLRTFKYRLWKNIRKEDILDKDGKIYSMCGDLPVIFPMLEMAEERSFYIEDILHVYNRSNPLNEDKVNHGLQLGIEAEVREKPVYPRLEVMEKRNEE